ncbi:MAG: hypothetical protein GXY80_15395 [Syntrophorhabdus aromaticivorans]|uniref:Uncharacterized protein n=1 Tax=Syntrophorhabdus aromaticivorans TaxID=328301 RepID=A0A351U5X1_9BACT|nr:hypothetical protein [Syntrophorhabdus aromaticivorans]HBA55352.1 hypothetical protein [Syntrophorhabdus aromaticivorans]
MRVKMTRADREKLDYIRGHMCREDYLRLLIETRYNEARKEWRERMKLYREIQHVKHVLEVAARRKGAEQ